MPIQAFYETRRPLTIVLPALCLVAALAASLYLARGLHTALLNPRGSNDLLFRHGESLYILRGVNPNHVYERLREYPRAPEVPLDPAIRLTSGGGGYPPWAYGFGLLLAPPWLPEYPVKLLAAATNLLALAVVALASARLARNILDESESKSESETRTRPPHPAPRAFVLFFAILPLGLAANSFALGSAQYGLLVNALLVLAALAAHRGTHLLAGFLFALALVKPSLSAPFLGVLAPPAALGRPALRAALAAAATLAALSAIPWIATGSDPLLMLRQMIDPARAGGGLGGQTFQGPLRALLDAFPGRDALVLVPFALAGLALAAIAHFRFRPASPPAPAADLLDRIALAASVAAFWTVHRGYDDMILLFPLLALARRALVPQPRTPDVLLFAALLAVLWAPPSLSVNVPFAWLKYLVALAAAVRLFTLRVTLDPSTPNPTPNPNP